MKYPPILSAVVAFTCVACLPLFSAEYHVSKDGSDENTGTLELPFLTIEKASSLLEAGDTCYIHAGIYRETLIPQQSGTEDAFIRYTAFENDDVVISGTEIATDWQLYQDGIYQAQLATSLEGEKMVFHNASAQQLARWPNDLDGNPYTYDTYYIDTTSGTYSDSYITNESIPDYWTDGVMFWLGAHGGCAIQRKITGIDTANHRLSFTPFPSKWPFGTHSPTRWENGHRGTFYLMNHLDALDAPGEWYYDTTNQTLYYYPTEVEQLEMDTIEYTVRERTLQSSRSYIVFENLNFFGAPIQINGSHQILQNLRVRECVNTLITDEESATAGGAAISVWSADVTIENCLVEEGSASGITLGANAENAVVRNCVIRNFDKQGNHCCPLRANAPLALFTQNHISGSSRDVSRSTGANSEMSYNIVSHGLLACSDGGLFYVTGNSVPKDIELHHNWFYHAYSPDYTDGRSTGIYLDNDSAGFNVHHNVVWDVKWGGLHFNWDALENQIFNNTFWNVGTNEEDDEKEALILCWVPERDGVRTNVRNNDIINNLCDVREWWDSGAGDFQPDETLDNVFRNNVQVEEPPFVSLENQNFVPVAHEAIIDRGELLPDVNEDYVGLAPDIGAYEKGLVPWKPGPDWIPGDFHWLVPSKMEADPDIRELSVGDFQISGGNVVSASVAEGTLATVTEDDGEDGNEASAEQDYTEIRCVWDGLSLDPQAEEDSETETDDAIFFTVVLYAEDATTQQYKAVGFNDSGWTIDANPLYFEIKDVELSEHTDGTISFSGFEGIQIETQATENDNSEADDNAIFLNNQIVGVDELTASENQISFGLLKSKIKLSTAADSTLTALLKHIDFRFIYTPETEEAIDQQEE